MRILLIDHYDSFTWNVVDWLRRDRRRPTVEVVPYDCADELARAALAADSFLISPGPKSPDDAPQTLALLARFLGRRPILGVCLGHQMLAQMAGGKIKAARDPWHGTARRIDVLHDDGLFRGMPPTFAAAIYNSLIAESLGPSWRVDARCSLGEIQAISYRPKDRLAPACGVQFHPESHLSAHADLLRSNWLDMCADYAARTKENARA